MYDIEVKQKNRFLFNMWSIPDAIILQIAVCLFV